MARPGLRGLRSLAILHTTFVSKVAAFLGLFLTVWGLAVFVHLLFDETGAFLDFSFDAHVCLSLCWLPLQRRPLRADNSRRRYFAPLSHAAFWRRHAAATLWWSQRADWPPELHRRPRSSPLPECASAAFERVP